MLGTATIKVRPLKLALLVDPNNASQVREAIRLACSLWGGMFFPIIPMHRRMPGSCRTQLAKMPPAEHVVRGYIEAFDPDALVQFGSELPSYVSEMRLRVLKPQDVWRHTASSREPEPAFGLSVLDVLHDVYNECFKFKLKYPTKVVVPSIPKEHGLFWASVYGEYPPSVWSAISKLYSEALEIERPQITPETFLPLMSLSVHFPRRVTSWGLTVQGGGLRFGRQSCVFFMDASNIEDIVDYWNLRATGRSVIPLPKQFLHEASFRTAVEDFLVQERRAWVHDAKQFDVASLIQSRHSTMEEMGAFAKSLKFSHDKSGDSESRYFTLQHWYPRIWDEWARGKDGGVADIYSVEEESIDISGTADLEMRLKPLLPKFAGDTWHRAEAICANEFDLRLYGASEHLAQVYPRVRGDHLARAISGLTGLREWRVGRHGLVKLVQHSFSESRTIPASEAIFFAWLADHGWKAELSPPGILAKQIYTRLGGYPQLLADRSVLGLIEYMNGGSVGKNGLPGSDDRLGGEREVAVGELKSRLKGPRGTSTRYDTLLEKGVFKLGLKTRCPNCQRSTWFALSALKEMLDCPKCLSPFAAVGNIDQSSANWFYRTAGPFSVPNFADGAYTVLLTLDALGDRMFSGLRTTSVPSFIATSSGKGQLEADCAMFWRDMIGGEISDGLLFGECKTYGLFEAKDFERMRYIGDTFPGAVLVFSTLRETLTKGEITALKKLTKAGRKYWKVERPLNPVLILTGRELLTWKRPPHCWDEGQQERFSHVHDLLSLCDATQQIYLGLPSWGEEWRAQSVKRSERRQARQTTVCKDD